MKQFGFTFAQAAVRFLQTVLSAATETNNWKGHWGLPTPVPAVPVTTSYSPFKMHSPRCRYLFSCCLYSDEGCTKPASFIPRNFLISHLFVAVCMHMFFYQRCSVMYRPLSLLGVDFFGVSTDTTTISVTPPQDLANWVIQVTSHKTGCLVPLSLPNSQFQFPSFNTDEWNYLCSSSVFTWSCPHPILLEYLC